MEANVEAIVNDLNNISINQVLYEIIMNSIQANAIKIDVKIVQSSLLEDDKTPYIDKIEVIDDGDGFTKDNIDSFKQYRSMHKKSIGAKGIGRFLYLKLFKNVSIDSLDKHIDFTIKDDVKINNRDFQKNTSVKLEKPKNKIFIDLNSLELKIKEHFLPSFSLFKNGKKVSITVCENDKKLFTIDSSKTPILKEKMFKTKSHEFKIRYIIDSDEITNYDGFYCANNRVVLKNSEMDSKIKLKAFKGVKILFLLSSEYLDNNVNDERNEFSSIYPVRKNHEDVFGNLSWDEIQESLAKTLKAILLDNDIDVDKEAKSHLKEAIKKAPYLAYYLKENEYGFKEKTLISNAKKQLREDKEFLRNKENMYKEGYGKKLSIVTQSELAEYIYDRQKIIEKLKELVDYEALEKEVHNLFIEQKISNDKIDYKNNNLWLFDDRFMMYDKIFSDIQMKEIFPELKKRLKRPDILTVVSNTHTKENITDIVIIELKRPDENITPAGAEEQLLDYSRYVHESNFENKIRIWTYAFLKYDDETGDRLRSKDYNMIPTHSDYPIYYHYYGKENTIINFMDYRTLAYDAGNRNKTFMDILTGNSLTEKN